MLALLTAGALAALSAVPAEAQWIVQKSGTDASLRGVSAVSDKVVWASGTGGTVLRTIDGGEHWQVIHVGDTVPGAEKLDFRDVEGFDAKTAVIMSAGLAEQGQAKIFKTTDAGAHWKQVFATDRKGVFFDSMAFWGEGKKKHGIGVSDPVEGSFVIFATDDGGDSWHFVSPKQMPEALAGEGAFAASGTAIAVAGNKDVWFGTGGARVSRLFHSADAGQTWTAVETPIPAGKASAGIFSVAFRDPKHGAVVGGDYSAPEASNSNAAFTSDGGLHWRPAKKSLPYLSCVIWAGPADGSVQAVGSAAYISSDNNGLSWRPLTHHGVNAISGRLEMFGVGAHGFIGRALIATDNND